VCVSNQMIGLHTPIPRGPQFLWLTKTPSYVPWFWQMTVIGWSLLQTDASTRVPNGGTAARD
jgi:hypothetical protein